MAGVGQVEPFDEVRRELIHQLSIRPMAHSELVKALPENVSVFTVCLSVRLSVFLPLCLLTCFPQGSKETGLERVIDSVALFRSVSPPQRGSAPHAF